MVNQHPDWTLEEYCEQWQAVSGTRLSASAMCRFLSKQNLSLKKKLRSAQAATALVQQKRLEYWQSIRDVEPSNLVFLDEMGVLLGLMRFLSRVCPKTWEAVDQLVKLAIRLSNPRHFRNWLAHCCYWAS